jgi:protein tyrosine/serine phosphatase
VRFSTGRSLKWIIAEKQPEKNHPMIQTEIEGLLLRSPRPGRHLAKTNSVPESVVTAWIEEARGQGVVAIICLLDDQHLGLYKHCAGGAGLLKAYRDSGFDVVHIPVRDHCRPAGPEPELQRAVAAYQSLPKPVLVHCSAGMDRTGAVVRAIRSTSVPGDPRQ